MKEEIRVGVEFLRQFLAKYGHQLSPNVINSFATSLTSTLHTRYANHWYSEMPMKGQAFRCLRLKRSENYIDPTLEAILKQLNLSLSQLGLPNDFTLWIDPGEVSVRFGDQVGYTYTIAKLDEKLLQKQDLSLHIDETFFSNDKCVSTSPNLIVESAEKILFDEKLSAFIRQNSSSNEDSLADSVAEFNTIEEVKDIEDFNMNDLIKLSAEQRTISPPCSSMLIRKNSSNIAIICDEEKKAARIAENQINTGSFDYTNSYNTLAVRQHKHQQQPGNFSFSDSCYYSSSSSSCASSFGSNYDDGNSLMSKFIKNSNNNRGISANFNYFGSTDGSLTPPFCKNYGQSSQLPFTNNLQNNNSFFSPINQNFGFLNESATNPNIFSGSTNSSLFQMDNSIYSECSSERSDTPNSCVTNASSSKSNANQFLSSPYHAIVPFSVSANSKDIDNAISCTTSLSSSSDTSTATTLSDNNSIVLENACVGMDLFEDEVISTVEKQQLQGNKNNCISKKEEGDKNQTKENSKSDEKNCEKDEKYCGYVESFPYYYKLNRLYNALAVQKMQTERLRKSNNISPFNGQSTIRGTSMAYSPNQLAGQVTANQMQLNQHQMRNGKIVANGPSNFTPSFVGSPYGSEMQSSVLISESSPPLKQHFMINNPTASMHHINNSNQFLKTKSQQYQQQQQMSKLSPTNNRTGFSMSLASSPQSYANHNQNNQLNQSNNKQQHQNRHSLQFTNQQHQNFLNNMTFMNNNPNIFPGKPINRIRNNMNSDVVPQIGQEIVGNNNLMFNSQINNNNNGSFSPQQQQQILNSMYNQINLRRNQDLVKLN